MIELSVHLITFNNEKYIDDTLQSILKQKTNFSFEIVVGDDCSTDNTLGIINEYDVNHPNLFNIKQNKKRLGILKNFKSTLDRCKGHYVFDLAGDDLLKSDYALQKMVDVLKNDDSLGFVDSGIDKLYEKNSKLIPFSNKNVLQNSKDIYRRHLLLGKLNPIGICYNKKHLYQYVDFETYLEKNITIEDYPILVDLVKNTNFETINEVLHIYRVHDQSYSHTKSFQSHFFLKNQMKMLFKYFSKKYGYNHDLIETFNKYFFKDVLFLSGYFGQKEIGHQMFKKIKSKSFKDYIHFCASQNTYFRKLVSMF